MHAVHTSRYAASIDVVCDSSSSAGNMIVNMTHSSVLWIIKNKQQCCLLDGYKLSDHQFLLMQQNKMYLYGCTLNRVGGRQSKHPVVTLPAVSRNGEAASAAGRDPDQNEVSLKRKSTEIRQNPFGHVWMQLKGQFLTWTSQFSVYHQVANFKIWLSGLKKYKRKQLDRRISQSDVIPWINSRD